MADHLPRRRLADGSRHRDERAAIAVAAGHGQIIHRPRGSRRRAAAESPAAHPATSRSINGAGAAEGLQFPQAIGRIPGQRLDGFRLAAIVGLGIHGDEQVAGTLVAQGVSDARRQFCRRPRIEPAAAGDGSEVIRRPERHCGQCHAIRPVIVIADPAAKSSAATGFSIQHGRRCLASGGTVACGIQPGSMAVSPVRSGIDSNCSAPSGHGHRPHRAAPGCPPLLPRLRPTARSGRCRSRCGRWGDSP